MRDDLEAWLMTIIDKFSLHHPNQVWSKGGERYVFKGLADYISNNPSSKGKSFHLTMTYFWIQIVHLGISNVAQQPRKNVDQGAVVEPQPDAVMNPFSEFLLVNPYVVDGSLWAEFYSKNVIMAPQAKSEFFIPDIKPLPNLVVRDAIKRSVDSAQGA